MRMMMAQKDLVTEKYFQILFVTIKHKSIGSEEA